MNILTFSSEDRHAKSVVCVRARARVGVEREREI